APNNLSSSNTDTRFGYEGATQLMIWEIILGLRNATPPYARINNKLYSNFKNSDFPSFVKGYDAIADKLAKHKTIPSFSSGDEASAPTYQLKYDAATGMCTGDLTDQNGVLDAYTFTAPNVTFTRDGNTLHVSAPLTAFESGPILASAKGSSLKEESAVLYCWTAADSTKQTLIQTFKTSAEQATAYFKLEAEMISTTLTILKEADDGHVADIPFTVTDQSGSRVFEGKTDSKGDLLVPGLVIGETYVITESVPEGYKAEKASQTVTITSGVNKVTFRNTLITGGLVIYKSSDAHDVPLEGAVFELRDSDGNLIERLITDEDGKASVFDLPYGAYFLEEVEAPEGFVIDDTIYSFSIQDDGQVFEFSAVNEPIPGSISIRKVDPSGRPLAGVTFLLEYSEDGGKEWAPIMARADGYPVTIGTTTSDVTDGKLTTDENGEVTFEGLMIRSQLGEILYRLTETETVPGYSLLPESILVGELTEEETAVSFEVVNEPVTVLPFTGRAGFKVIYLLSLLTIPAAVVLIKKRKVE
ncbi:MAG: SpaA isopeptide-forming pilin-related protein, partial [Candidatus Cryptobacteroides sp.]